MFVMVRFSCKHTEMPLSAIKSEFIRFNSREEFEHEQETRFVQTQRAIREQYEDEGLWTPKGNQLTLVRTLRSVECPPESYICIRRPEEEEEEDSEK